MFLVRTEQAQQAKVHAGKWRDDISLVQTEQVRSISSLLYDQKSCECLVKTQQDVIVPIFKILSV